MSLKTYVVTIWKAVVGKDEIEAVRDIGKESGEAYGQAWLEGFKEGAGDKVQTGLSEFFGVEEPLLIKAEVVAPPTLSEMTKEELRVFAEEHELEGVDWRWSVEDIAIALQEATEV